MIELLAILCIVSVSKIRYRISFRKFALQLAQKHQLERFFVSTTIYSASEMRELLSIENTFDKDIAGKFLLTMCKIVPTLWVVERYFDRSLPPGDMFGLPKDHWTALADELVENGCMGVVFSRGDHVISEKWSPFRTIMYHAEP